MTWEKLEVPTTPSDRLLAAVWGEPKTGKTEFALSYPDPIYFMNFDWGLEHHLPKLAGRDIYISSYAPTSLNPSTEEATSRLVAFERDFAAVLKAGTGSLIMDTASQLWTLISKVFLDPIAAKRKDGNIFPFDYAGPQAYFTNLVNKVKDCPDLNLCLVQRAREKYNSSGNPTGVFEAQGNGNTAYLTQIQMRLYKRDGGHYGVIESAWQTSAVEGVELENPTYSSIKTFIQAMMGVSA